MSDISSTREFVASIISSIAQKGHLTSATEAKAELLTLHVLFAKELLPALDLLDRGLVTRINVGRESDRVGTEGHSESGSSNPGSGVALAQDRALDAAETTFTYYVRSSRQSQPARRTAIRTRPSDYDSTTYYEVRLSAWTCSCPAFLFAAFPATDPSRDETTRHNDSGPVVARPVGGLSLGHDIPMCKHLLACLLIAQGCAPPDSFETRVVSRAELAGWAAGWGD